MKKLKFKKIETKDHTASFKITMNDWVNFLSACRAEDIKPAEALRQLISSFVNNQK